ncbi:MULTISPECIES: hydrogen gas-evolving membrane-bound hydrogenase subunit E [Kosmotoga]|uniref:hydrogen gas-evolving membrane-bound hydrogenase subunit E n=1 Tax=Kosmotoga TaxID=651456 RepID=UPI0001848B8D|nr:MULTISPECIES: hydrogen gas-evolving membrane-bound hydrogenase subunit E [Kosmotoga]OAA23172.1 hypothetical protein DU53_02990 [Kosmotoga sp. DU53]
MPIESWMYFLIGFMIFASIVALEIKDLLSSVISVGMVGLAVAVAFLFLQAPDLALVQFVYEIISVIILILLLKNSGERYETVKESKVSFSAKLVVILLVLFLIAPLFSILPEFGKPLLEVSERYLESGTEETGAVNLVTSVVLDYRVYDTLGEATILFVSILGVVTLLRKRDKGKDDI